MRYLFLLATFALLGSVLIVSGCCGLGSPTNPKIAACEKEKEGLTRDNCYYALVYYNTENNNNLTKSEQRDVCSKIQNPELASGCLMILYYT